MLLFSSIETANFKTTRISSSKSCVRIGHGLNVYLSVVEVLGGARLKGEIFGKVFALLYLTTMKKLGFLAMVGFLLASCSSYSPKDNVEKAICEEYEASNVDFHIVDISKSDSVNTTEIKDSVKMYLEKIESILKIIDNQNAVDLLLPDARAVITDLTSLTTEPNLVYRTYTLHLVKENDILRKNVYANVVYDNDKIKRPINIRNSNDQPVMIVKFENLKPGLLELLSKLEDLSKKTSSEVEVLCKEERNRLEQLRLITELEKKKAEAEAEANRPVSSWNDVAKIVSKRGKVIGIWKNGGPYSSTLVMYQNGGNYYMAYCSFSKNPIDDGSIMRLRKKSGNTYEYREDGSDMPERFKINAQGNMDSYTFNPDGPYGPEWVFMGSYIKIY